MSEYYVIVVGAGNAALAAAVSAKEHGARVLLLEKAAKNMRGGNTHWSGGLLRYAYGDPQNLRPLIPDAEREHADFYDGIKPYTPDDFHQDLMRVTSGRTDPVLSRLLVEQSKDTVEWMHRVGRVEMEPAVSVAAVRKGNSLVWLRGLAIRAIHEGVGLSSSWFKTCQVMGIDVRYETAALSLVVNADGRVGGVKVRDASGVHTVEGDSVILGCGGFEANAQMRTQYIGPLLGEAKVRGTPHNQGDGLRMALDIGAMPWGQWSGCHATPISADWGDFAPRAMTDRSNRLSYPYSVMINRAGKRFVDEGENTQLMTYAKFGRAILAQPGSKVWQIFDSNAIRLLEPRYATSKPKSAETIEALIAQLDIEDKAKAIETITAYNAAARVQVNAGGQASPVANAAAVFDPTRLDGLATRGLDIDKTNWALPIATPPFVAYSATGGITFTFGGLRINPQAEVIGTDWRAIPGLYACGEMVGGLYYDNYPAGTGLVSGATFGRIAGRNAALRSPVLDAASPGRTGSTTVKAKETDKDVMPLAESAGRADPTGGWVP